MASSSVLSVILTVERSLHFQLRRNNLAVVSKGAILLLFGREAINWENVFSGHGDGLGVEIRSLDKLDQRDVLEFLARVPITEPGLQEHIADLCAGHPLLLDLCTDIYEQLVRAGRSPSPADFGRTTRQVLERSLDHITLEERGVINMLAVPNHFDRRLFEYLLSRCGFGSLLTKFDVFVQYSFVQAIESTNWYRFHDVMRDYILGSMPFSVRHKYEDSVFEYCRMLSNPEASWANKLESLRQGCAVLRPEHSGGGAWLLALLKDHIEEGYWQDARQAVQLLSPAARKVYGDHIRFAEAVLERRLGNLPASKRLHDAVSADALGSFKYYALYHRANAVRLCGDYKMAGALYRTLLQDRRLEKEDESTFVEASRQYANFLTLRGRFREALELLDELLQRPQLREIERAELLREKGHVYRFNCCADRAVGFYEDAMSIARDLHSPGLRMKLSTNLVEVRACALWSRDMAVEDDAVRGNRDLGATLEVCKALAARSICRLVNDQDITGSLADARAAREIQERIGYAAGRIFVNVSTALNCLASGDEEHLDAELADLWNTTQQLEVYRFMTIPFRKYFPRAARLSQARWLDRDVVERHWNRILSKVGKVAQSARKV